MAETTKSATPSTAPAPEAASSGQQATGTEATQQAQAERTYSQSDLDRAVRQALKTREENLERQKAEALKAQEQESAIKRGEFEKVLAASKAELEGLRAQQAATRASYELKLAAVQAGMNDTDDVRLLGDDVLKTLTDDSGQVQRDAVAKAIEALKTSKPYLFKSAQQNAPQGKGQPTPGSAVPSAPPDGQLTAEQYFKLRATTSERQRNLAPPSTTDLLREILSGRK